MAPLADPDQAIARHGLRQMFPACAGERLESVLAQLEPCRLAPGEVLLRVDDPGRCAFLLLEGSLQVYGRGPEDALVAIATLTTPGRLLGEQALLPGHHHRNADVIALQPTRLARLPEALFEALLAGDPSALEPLQRRALEELRRRLGLLGIGLEDGLIEQAETGSLQLESGERLLEAGRIPEQAWSVLSGELNLLHPGEGEPLLCLGPGSLLAVQEVLSRQPFRRDAVASGPVEVLPIGSERLQRLIGREETAASLQALVAVPGLGRVFRTRSLCEGRITVISEYSDLPGGAVRVRQTPGLHRIEATRPLTDGRRLRRCQTPDGRGELLLEEDTGRLLGLALDQSCPQLADLMGLLLRDVPLSPLQWRAFEASGQILLESPEQRVSPASEIVCACTGTTGRALREIGRCCSSLVELQRLTGAGTVCGGCLNRLPLFLNQPTEARLCRIRSTPLARGSVRLRLEPLDPEPLPPWRAGEHLVVEALIEGRWIGRSYTLTGGDEGHYELGIKQESGGLLSNWLAQPDGAALVRIRSPQGDLRPAGDDPRPLLYLVAGIGVTPAIAGLSRLAGRRRVCIAYTFRGADTAAYLGELRQAAERGEITLLEHDSSLHGRLDPERWLETLAPLLEAPLEVVICGPRAFNTHWNSLLSLRSGLLVRLESFAPSAAGHAGSRDPGAWRLSPEDLAERRRASEERFGPIPPPVEVGHTAPLAEAHSFLDSFRREAAPDLDLDGRLAEVAAQLQRCGQWQPSHAELRFGASLAWRQAERCVGRLYWQGLQLFDRRDLRTAEAMAEALFEHLRHAFHGGDLRPAISVFDPGEPGRPGPRIWNPQLLRYAGHRGAGGRQVGDPAQNDLTARLRDLGWRPEGGDFELLPLVIQTAEEGPRLFPLPADCRREVFLRHPRHAWLEELGLRWTAVPAVSDMALDLGGTLFRMAPFNGWYLDTEIAARNLSDANRYNLLPRLAERLGFDLREERDLWRDHAQLLLSEAVLHSFDQAGVKISDHHSIGHEFLEFCRSEQGQGREPQAEWGWVVPPMAGSLNVLYQEPFENRSYKPAFVLQPPIWRKDPASGVSGGCPFSS
ncbi:MAG: nitric oxide synthase oxygenase [Cyanobium sp.]